VKELRFSDPNLAAAIMIRLLPDGKVVAKLGETHFHYTLHPGHNSGAIDLHETNELVAEGNPSRHKTLWRQSRDQILDALHSVGPRLVVDLMSLFRPIRLGWIIRRGLSIGFRIPSELEVTKISLRSGELEMIPASFRPPEFYEDVLQPPLGGYTLFRRQGSRYIPHGLMVSYSNKSREVQLRWTKLHDLRQFQARWEPILSAALQS
jgi:hypothetical protein